jgi:hypothetical protein
MDSRGFVLSAGVLFRTAVTAYQRTATAATDLAPGQSDALVAVLFAAASLEALVMDFAHLARSDFVQASDPRLGLLAKVLEEAEQSRSSTRLKFILMHAILSGTEFNKGIQLHADLDTLFSLRNSVVHLKPELISDEPHRLVKRLQARSLCEPPNTMSTVPFISSIMTRAVARWACATTLAMAESLKSLVPSDAVPLTTYLTGAFQFAP